MGLTALIELGMGLILLLAILIFFLFQQRKKVQKKIIPQTDNIPTLTSLLLIIQDKNSTTEQLMKSLETIIEYYGIIENIDIYNDILYRICKHPNTKTTLILKFDRELTKKNHNYKKEITDAISKGLNSRS